jgi:hypothetical protein
MRIDIQALLIFHRVKYMVGLDHFDLFKCKGQFGSNKTNVGQQKSRNQCGFFVRAVFSSSPIVYHANTVKVYAKA